MKQVIVIHGGTTYAQYEDFINDLKHKPVYLDRMTYQPKWKELLQAELGNEYHVLLPSMPNATNAKYSEWKLWFDRISAELEDECILVGHSLGAIFLAKYLSENAFARRIKGTIFIAAPFNNEDTEDLADFKLNSVSEQFSQQAGEVTFFFGTNDPVIPLSEMHSYQNYLPDAKYITTSAPDHFVRVLFPELTEVIAAL